MVLFGGFLGRLLFGWKENNKQIEGQKTNGDLVNLVAGGRHGFSTQLTVDVSKDSQAPPWMSQMISVFDIPPEDVPKFIRIQEICSAFCLSNEKLGKIMDRLLKRMEEGLDRDRVAKAAVKMLPSYVRAVPNGTEHGNYLALDLGGTNFRVLLIRLKGKEAEMSGQIFRVPHEFMVGTGEALFDHIAECMKMFMEQEGLLGQKLPLGFTFSFPCEQEGLTKAKLISWTKGFTASGVEGMDVVTLLKRAVDKRTDIEIDVVALLNDTTGTLMACAHKENSCSIGVIVGTGSNACYMEKIVNCNKLEGDIDPNDGGPEEVIINTEWGAFGNQGSLDFILTQFDRNVDKHSINPGKQIFEKMISGMYMGEIVRLVLEYLCAEGLLFDGKGSEELSTKGTFPTKYVSEIESDMLEEDRSFGNTYNILEDLGLESITPADCANVAYVCTMVSTRAAYLCSAGIATLINRMRKPYSTVAVDGSVYRFHPRFKILLEEKIPELIDPDLDFQLMLSEDGSGKGAALVAAVACRIAEEKLAKKLSNQSL